MVGRAGAEAAAGGHVGELSGKGHGQRGRKMGGGAGVVTRASGESGWRLGRASPALTPPLTQHPGSTAPVLTLPGPLGLPSALSALLWVHWPGPALASRGSVGGQQADGESQEEEHCSHQEHRAKTDGWRGRRKPLWALKKPRRPLRGPWGGRAGRRPDASGHRLINLRGEPRLVGGLQVV